MMKTTRVKQLELVGLLCNVTNDLMETRATVMGREAIAHYRHRIAEERAALLDDDGPALIDWEATCLVEMLAELSYARADRDKVREDRVTSYLDRFHIRMKDIRDLATRKMEQEAL
ncbi:hypothetical protein ACWX0K_10840 [Nitrobacteraceae bacterium UC4446_H13]